MGRDAEARRPGFLGSGLPEWELAAILLLSVTTFLLWGGALWSAPAGASHIARIAVSYLMVVPLVAAALAAGRRWSWVHLLSSAALLWSAKLVITASLYAWFASGSASQYSPAQRSSEQAPALSPAAPKYQPAAAAAGLADLAGVIRERGEPVADAVVLVEDPRPGLALPPARDVAIAIHGARYDQSIFLTSTADRVVVRNGDATLHTLNIRRDGHTMRNLPVPPGAGSLPVSELAPGLYELSCENHASERATLVAVEHPYAARTDSAGRFLLRGVPGGDLNLLIVRHGHAPVRRLHAAGAPMETSVELGGSE